jgi:hypothetical protein
MILIMAILAQRHKVIRRVSASFATLYVVDVQYLVAAVALALAFVAVAEQHILAHVPKVELFSLLILCALYFWVLDFLYVERRYLDYDFTYRQYGAYPFDKFQVALYLMPNTRRKPPFRFLSVAEPRLPIPQTISACPTVLPFLR